MSQPQHHIPTPDAAAGIQATRTVRFWAAPIVLTLALLSALAALYLGGIVKPTSNLQHFPIAVVNDDAGPSGRQIVDGLAATMDPDKFDIRVLSATEARHQLDTAQVYGAVLIPSDFSKRFQQVARSALSLGELERPEITIATNPRAGSLGSSIAGQTLNRAITAVSTKAGERLSGQLRQHTGGAQLPGAVGSVLSDPIDIHNTVHDPLPEGTGNGLSAFYYALLLLLAGFTGSIVVSTVVDSMLGYVPAEFGPVYRFAEQANISRFRTLLVKWALMLVLALLTSGAYLAIAHWLEMPLPHAWAVWGYGAFAITAVGVTSTSLIAALGTLGLMASLLVFVILGLPSAGATVPLEAAPPFFSWLSGFEPMHQVFLGTRALLYLDGRADAGLTHAVTMTAIGLVLGLLIGAAATRAYDRRGYHRIHDPNHPIEDIIDVDAADDMPPPQPPTDSVADAGWSGSSVIR